MMRFKFVPLLALIMLLPVLEYPATATVAAPPPNTAGVNILSPYWSDTIREWSPMIAPLSEAYGLDADFIAAVIKAESNGVLNAVSHQGAVGLMGVMPAGPGMEWRPSTHDLADPGINLDWGVAILTEVIRQSGGDLHAALSAYSGGWDHVNSRVPQEYAARVLDDYGRAVATRSGISPEIATSWTVAIETRRGYIPQNAPLLVLGDEPVSGLYSYGEHVVYHGSDENGDSYYIKGYAVPVALTVPPGATTAAFGPSDSLEPELMRHLDHIKAKVPRGSSRVLLACLPTLSRLRGRVSTRWYAPSACPAWHR